MRIPIVDENDEVIEYVDAGDPNRKPTDINRVAALWLTNERGDILLAQRGFSKSRNPGKWGPAAAGTVEEGETYETNIVKEAEEEIALTGFDFKKEKKFRRSSGGHEYFNQWFSGVVPSDYPFVKQDSEVEAIRWVGQNELVDEFRKNPEIFIPTFAETLEYFLDLKP